MATNINGKKGLSANLLPSFYQTPANKKFLQSTIDQLFQPGTLTKIKGYIGRENAKASTGNDVYLKSANQIRQNYQLEPGLVIKDSSDNIAFFKDYIDYINQISIFGGNTSNHARLNKQEFYSWDPHIDWDKFVNFQNYYWLPYGPDTITIYGPQNVISTTYTVKLQTEGSNNQYVFTPDGSTPNPDLILYRGKTYKFDIDSPGNPFSFKTTRSTGSLNRYQRLNAVDNYAVESGTITISIPEDAPSILYYQSETDITSGGVIQILSIDENTNIDVTLEILGKKSVTLSDGTLLSNGMKIAFGGNVQPASYAVDQYYVEGVGKSIILVPASVLEVISPWSVDESIPFDSTPFDKAPWEDATSYASEVDYITINRSSRDHNPWSRYNRWFHKDVITASALYNNTTVGLDQTLRAVRPIIEFEADIRLFNFGTTAIFDIDIFDDTTGNTALNKHALPVFTAIEGTTSYQAPTGNPSVSIPLSDGMLVLFTGDPDPLVQNKIYRVEYIDVKHVAPTDNSPSGSKQLHLVEIASPELNQVVLVRQGKYQSQMFWFNGSSWIQAQQKLKVNQPPLFDIVDDSGTSFGDESVYTGTTFKGSKIFSYKIGTGQTDSKLGFPLSYQNVNNIGDIVFNFDLANDAFEYKKELGLISQNINVGYLSSLNYGGNTIYKNGWQTCTTENVQAAVRIYKNSGLTKSFQLDIFDNHNKLEDLVVKVYVNGHRLSSSNWNLVNSTPYKRIVLTTPISLTDVLTVRAFSSQPINANGYYEVPLNLQNNPLNDNMLNFTLGEVIDHVGTIVDNLPGFTGVFPGNSTLRDLGNITRYGTRFVQHSGPLSLGIYHVTSETNNIIKAIQQSRDDYNNFKRVFIDTASNLGKDGDPITITNLVLEKINANKPNTAPYYFSDMVPYGACIVSDLSVVDYRIKKYPLSTVFTLDKLSNKAVGVYLNGTQLINEQDYSFSNQSFVIIADRVNLKNGDTITTYEYDSTDGCFVPATPTKLGMYPSFIPQIYTDTTLVNPQTVIQGHDGSIVLAYGDYRDDLLLELEKRIFNNIKVKYNTDIFDISDVIPSYNRNTDYTLSEFNQVLAPNFYKWTNLIGKDLTTPLNYDRANSFTYNYSLNYAPDASTSLPGYWRGVYRYLLDTDRPNICPWEMLGFTIEPSWWQDVYGPAPYTSNNLPLWQDIANGTIRIPNQSAMYSKKYAKPFILNHIPVDDSGNLISPLDSGIAGGSLNPNIDNNFVFGDGSPVETAWSRSSHYPFSVLISSILLFPAKTFGILLDRSRIKRNLAGQLIYTATGLRITPADIILPSIYSSKSREQTAGLINYSVDLIFNYIFSNNLANYNSYQSDLRSMLPQLSYRMGAFSNQGQFNLLLESKTPTSSGNVFVPTDDYKIFLNKSSSIKKLNYSGVIITKLSTGFEIKGYSITQPYFNYYSPNNVGVTINVGGISENYSTWTAGQQYATGHVVKSDNVYYRTTVTHVSSNTFNSDYFVALPDLPMSGGVSAKLKNSWDRSSVNVAPYGTLITKLQDVVDFLLGYGEYLKDQGFLFDDFNRNLSAVANWETSAKEFMFWSTQTWSTEQDKWSDWSASQPYTYGTIVRYDGDYYSALFNIAPATTFDYTKWSILPGLSNVGSSVISLSPSANGITFVTDLAVVDSITSNFNPYEIFKVDGTPFEIAHIDSYRQENTVTYSPRTTDGIFGASFYLVQNEHIIVVNNKTIFNDIIYSPASGYRQERLKVSGYVTTDWYGGLDIPGFIFDSAAIKLWEPYQDYSIGDIVNHQGYYYSAPKLLGGTAVFSASDWTLLPKKPSSQILPNWTNVATQFTDFYNLEVDSFNTDQQSMAHHLIGYQKRQYLDNIIQDDVSEFKFYQGMIREKGTQNVLNKLFDVLSSDNLESLVFYEEWAIRVGQYGAANAFENVEFILNQEDYNRNNPQATLLVEQFNSSVSTFVNQQPANSVYLKPLGYNSNPFPLKESNNSFLRSAGHVNLLDVKLGIRDLSQLVSQSVASIKTGINYKILVPGATNFTQIGSSNNDPGTIFNATSVGTGDGTVSVDVTQFTEGDYIWCSFDDTVVSNTWNVYRFTDIGLRVTNATYSNNTLSITCKHLVNLKVGSYVGIVLELPNSQKIKGLDGFFQVASVSLNSFTVSAKIAGFPAHFTHLQQLVIFGLLTQRSTNIDLIDNILPKNLRQGDLLWTDNDASGKWAVWTYKPAFSKNTIKPKTRPSNLKFGKTTAINQLGTISAVGTATGSVSIYDRISKGLGWISRQYIQAPFTAHSDVNELSTLATVLAISPSGEWFLSGSPAAGNIATAYVGEYVSSNAYNIGDIVKYIDTYYEAIVLTPAHQTPSTKSLYWKSILYIPVSNQSDNSELSTQGAVSLYKKDINNTYTLVDTVISPMPANNEQFGQSIVLNDNVLWISAPGANDSQGAIYKFINTDTVQASTFYDAVGSSGVTMHVTSTAGISAGQLVRGVGFASGQAVKSVLSKLFFASIPGVPNYIRDTQNNNVNLNFISQATVVTGNGILPGTQVVKSGVDISGKYYVLVSSERDILQTVTTVTFTNSIISAEFTIDNIQSDATILLSSKPDQTPEGNLQFIVTNWKYDLTGTISGQQVNSNFGSVLSFSKDGSTLLVSSIETRIISPSETIMIGVVYVYKNNENTYSLIQTLEGTDSSFGQSTSISTNGEFISITDSTYPDNVSRHGRVSIYSLNTETNQYENPQYITDHYSDIGSNFGNLAAFMNNYDTLVVYSENAAGPQITSFDSGTVTFDKASTKIISSIIGSGRIDVYDRYNNNWVFGESLANPDENLDAFGAGFSVGNNSIFAGAPLFTPTDSDGNLITDSENTGVLYSYTKTENVYSWTRKDIQSKIVDVEKLKKSFLYNKSTDQLVTYLDVIDPIQGKIAGPADEELKYKTFYDPAVYSHSDGTVSVTVSTQTYWSKNQLGQLWWDLRSAKFIDPYFNNILYKSNTWNNLAPGATIDIYEWITSSVLPESWDAQADTPAGIALGISGTSLYGNKVYSVRQRYNNITKKFTNVYYFWVKNRRLTPAITGRRISALSVSNLISSPISEGYTYLSLIGGDSFALSNSYKYLEGNNTVLSVEYWTTDSIHRNIHSQWKLISSDSIVDLPHTIEQKWIDSLCGSDIAGRVVPDTELPPKLRYGIENRPRQSMFVNRIETLKEFVELTNISLLKHQITKTRDISKLEEYDIHPTVIHGLYDSTLDTEAELSYTNANLFQRPSLSPIIVDGKITGIMIINSGKGYLNPPYIQISGSGEGAIVRSVIDSSGRIISATVESSGYGYDDNTTCSVRDYCVLVLSDISANGVWSIYSYDPTYIDNTTRSVVGIWSRTQTQSYDVKNYWTYADWYGSYTDTSGKVLFTASQYTAADFSVATYADLNSIATKIGQLVKVLTVNTGGWELLYKYADSSSIDWTQSYSLVGIQNGTLQLNSNLYETSSTTVGYDSGIYDNTGFDIKAATELRRILNTLKNNIFINELKSSYLELFFSSIHYAHSEQLYLDWIFKTSFVRATHNVGDLGQPVYYPVDNLSNFQDYISEVKPYKTKVREYISNYTSTDISESAVTDFDLPPVFSNNALVPVETQVANEVLKFNSSVINTYPWKFWADTVGYSVTELKIVDGGSGYVTLPEVVISSNSGAGATAKAFFTNGVINRILLLTQGSGYLTAPVVSLVGGQSTGGVAARIVAIIGNGLARTNSVNIKFDRLTYTNYVNTLDVTETFTGTGSKLQYSLKWAPNVHVGKSSVYIDNNIVLRELYTLNIVSKVVGGYTQYSGTITFETAPTTLASIVVNYKKDISLLNAIDRIEFFYDPAAGEIGKEFNQLMLGIDYGGTIVGNLGFNTSKGWNDVPYAVNAWDVFDPTFNDYIITVGANTHSFKLPYTPKIGTEINVYYSQNSTTTTPSDGVSLNYNFNLLINQPVVSVVTNVYSISSVGITASTALATVNGITSQYAISTNLQSVLTSVFGAVGQGVVEFDHVSNIVVGQFVSGAGVATNTKVTYISNKFVTLSTNLSENASGNYNFFTLGTSLTLTSTTNIDAGLSVIGLGFTTQTVSKKLNSTTIILSSPPDLIPKVGEVIEFTNNSAGSKIIKVSSVANLKIGDGCDISTHQLGVFGYNTKIVSIDVINSSVTLNQILFVNLANNTSLTFTRILSQPVDAITYANGTATLTEVVPVGSDICIYGKIDPIRIDDPAFGTSQQANPDAKIPSIIIGTTQQPLLTRYPLVTGSFAYVITLPLDFTVNKGDEFIFRQSTSDGSIIPSDYDSDIVGGDMAYSSAQGLLADDIVVDGDGFTTPTSSPAPEEVVPGQVVDTLSIKVFDKPTAGNANIQVSNYVATGSQAIFELPKIFSNSQSIIVKLDGVIQTVTTDYIINYATRSVTFNATPSAKAIVSIFTIGLSGTNILDIEYFVGDGTTTEFVTRAPWLSDVYSLIYVNGLLADYVLFKTDSTYDLANATGIRFAVAPATGATINYIIVSGNQQTFSVTTTERIATNGSNTYTLNTIIGNSFPNESNVIVRVDQNILRAPNVSYFTIKSNKLTYSINTDKILPQSVSLQDIIVYVDNFTLIYGKDYTVDLTGISIKITKETYKAYTGKQLVISIQYNQGYMYNPATNQIVFANSYDSSHVVEVISSFRHDSLDIQRTEITARTIENITPESLVYYEYLSTLGGTIILDRPVINENYIWVIKSRDDTRTLLTPGVDYILHDNLTEIQLTSTFGVNDSVELITFGSNILKSGIAYMQFKDMLNRTVYKRLSLKKQTTLASDLLWNSTQIVLTDASEFQSPNQSSNVPGVIEIRGERIEYFSKVGNILSNIRRGTLGTGITRINKAGTFVQDIGNAETIPYKDSVSTTTFAANGTNIVPLGFTPSSVNEIEVFVGGIRLKKAPYELFNVNLGPYSNKDTIVKFDAEFTVDGQSNLVTLTNGTPETGTRVTVIKTTGISWDGKTSVMSDTSKIAEFIKSEPGIWYSEYK